MSGPSWSANGDPWLSSTSICQSKAPRSRRMIGVYLIPGGDDVRDRPMVRLVRDPEADDDVARAQERHPFVDAGREIRLRREVRAVVILRSGVVQRASLEHRRAEGLVDVAPGRGRRSDARSHAEIRLVEVQGHTDNVGLPNANQVLSDGRAKAVQKALVKRGVAACSSSWSTARSPEGSPRRLRRCRAARPQHIREDQWRRSYPSTRIFGSSHGSQGCRDGHAHPRAVDPTTLGAPRRPSGLGGSSSTLRRPTKRHLARLRLLLGGRLRLGVDVLGLGLGLELGEAPSRRGIELDEHRVIKPAGKRLRWWRIKASTPRRSLSAESKPRRRYDGRGGPRRPRHRRAPEGRRTARARTRPAGRSDLGAGCRLRPRRPLRAARKGRASAWTCTWRDRSSSRSPASTSARRTLTASRMDIPVARGASLFSTKRKASRMLGWTWANGSKPRSAYGKTLTTSVAPLWYATISSSLGETAIRSTSSSSWRT